MLKIAGVKTETAFYKKFPTQEAFMKVHGKEFKKAQTGAAIKKAQNFGNLDANNNGILDAMENPGGFNSSMYGQTANYSDTRGYTDGQAIRQPSYSTPGFVEGMGMADYENQGDQSNMRSFRTPTQTNPYGTFAPGNVSSFDIDNNGIPDTIQQAEGNPLMNNSSSTEEKKQPFDVPGLLNFTGGLINAGEGIKAAEAQTKHLETWADVSKVRKKAAISNAFVPIQPRQYYRGDELKNIVAANERGNTTGRGTDVFNVQNGSMIGGNPTWTQNNYGPDYTLYDDLGYEPFRETEDDNVKAFQGGGPFGNMLGGGGSGGSTPFLGGSALGQGGLFGGGNGGGSWLAGAMGGDSSYANAASMIPGPVGMFATMAARFMDPNPGKQRNAMNTINSNNRYINDIASGKFITRALSNSAVGQNGENLEMYEEGGYMNPEYNPQVITMFGDHNASDFADYAHKYRAGGHLKEYTAPSDRAMETYAMGGKIQSHWGGNVEDESYNPYMPGSGITSMIKGASHKNGGVGISYGGGGAQNGYGYAASGANMGAQIEAEGGESMIEMAEGGQINPQTGEQDTNAVVIGNIPMNAQMAEATGDADLIEIAKENPNTSMKKIFEKYTAEEVKATKDLEKASKLANEAKSPLDVKTAETIEESAKATLKIIANKKIKMAKFQDTLHKIKESISQSRGKNISAEALGRGQIKDDLDPITKDAPIGNAKSGAYLRKAQNNATVPAATEEPALTEAEYNELVKLYEEGEATPSKKSAAIKNFQRKYHQKFPKEALAAIQKTTRENGLSNEAKKLGLTKEDILAGKDIDKILQSNEDEFWGPRTKQYMASINSAFNKRPPLQLNALGATASTTGQSTTAKPGIDVVPLKKNSAMDAMGMISQLFQRKNFPAMDQRQFAGEDMAAALNVQQPVPMQKPYVELDPIYRMNYNDVRNANTAGFRDMLRQNQGNPEAAAMAFANFAKQNQTIGGEEFRTNQAIEQQIYGGNRAKMNANQEKGIALNIDQANKQSIAKTKTDDRNIEIAKSRADKEMKYTADKNKFLTASNLFPKYGYGANYQTQMQGPGYNPTIPQIYGGKSTIQQVPVYKNGVLDHYEMIEGDGTTTNTTTLAPWQTPPYVAPTKNGGKVKKNYKNSSVVRAYKNL